MVEGLATHELVSMDLRLHTRIHLAGITNRTENEAMTGKDVEEGTSKTYFIKDNGKLGGPQGKLEDLK